MSRDDVPEESSGIEFVTPGPDAVEIVVETARELAGEGKFEQAEAMLRSIVEGQPKHVPALLLLGAVLLELGRADEAIAVNERVLEINPDIPTPFVNIGYAFILKGDYDQAVSECEEAIFIDPADPVPYGNLSLAYLLKEDWEMCLRVTDKLLELDPHSGLAHNNAAVACLRKGALADAVGHVKQAVDLGYPVEDGFLEELTKAVRQEAASGSDRSAETGGPSGSG